MKEYLDLIKRVLREGEKKNDRTGVGTISKFGEMCKYDLTEGFPLVTTKKVNFTNVVKELLWFISGHCYDNSLLDCNIWKPWADEKNQLGPIYGVQWRKWLDHNYRPIDQIENLLAEITRNPSSRRLIVSSWAVHELEKMALPPCHVLFQINISGNYMDLALYQRSADIAIGVPYNIASYSLLLAMIAKETGYIPRYFVHHIGDAHIYSNHVDGLSKQIQRMPKERPVLELDYDHSILDVEDRKPLITPEMIKLHNYDPYPFIKFEIAV